MAMQGPNCLGMINYVDGVPLMFGVAPFETLGDRKGVAVVSQSGAMASAVRVALQARGIGVSYSVSTGNEASLGAEDFLEEFIADPHTRVIAMLMEQIRRPARFLDLAARARDAGKFIVLHHLGRSAAGRDAAKTHTGALSGDYAVMAAQVVARGVCLVDSLELLIDVPELLIRLRNAAIPGRDCDHRGIRSLQGHGARFLRDGRTGAAAVVCIDTRGARERAAGFFPAKQSSRPDGAAADRSEPCTAECWT